MHAEGLNLGERPQKRSTNGYECRIITNWHTLAEAFGLRVDGSFFYI